jgi:hypothetical protein
MGGPPIDGCKRSIRAISGLSQVENGLTLCRASCRPAQACYHHHRSKKPVAFADLVEPASPLAVDAIVQELEEEEDYAPKRPPSAGRNLLSVQLHHPSSEPQVVTAQLVDGPAAHKLHVAFDFGSEIFKRPFTPA